MVDLSKFVVPDDAGLRAKKLKLVVNLLNSTEKKWQKISREVGYSKKKLEERKKVDLRLAKLRFYKKKLEAAG